MDFITFEDMVIIGLDGWDFHVRRKSEKQAKYDQIKEGKICRNSGYYFRTIFVNFKNDKILKYCNFYNLALLTKSAVIGVKYNELILSYRTWRCSKDISPMLCEILS